MKNKQKVVFILGPTGVGKTKLSVWIAKKFNGEIISADSVQIFKEFDVGSAKVTQEEMSGIKHYGIDIVNPDEEFSVFDYIEYTKRCIEKISKEGKLPVIVGGTGLYVKALTEGYNLGGTEKNAQFREELEEKIKKDGLESVYQVLKDKSPEMAEKTDKDNKVRVIRALEIATFGGDKEKTNECEYDTSYATLIYYTNIAQDNGNVVASTTFTTKKATSNVSQGPSLAKEYLPTTSQWSNVSLKTTSRRILNYSCGASHPTFSYEGYAARFATLQEVKTACNMPDSQINWSTGSLDVCKHLLENLGNGDYWLEGNSSNYNDQFPFIKGSERRIGLHYASQLYGVRPVIDVAKSDIDF